MPGVQLVQAIQLCSIFPGKKLNDIVINTLCDTALSSKRIEVIVPELVITPKGAVKAMTGGLKH